MRLARGDKSIRVAGTDDDPSPVDDLPSPLDGRVDAAALATVQGLVIAVARSPGERMRIAELVDGAPLLLVPRPEDAAAFLAAGIAAGTTDPSLDDEAVASPPHHGLVVDSDARLARWREERVSLSPLEHDLLRCLLDEVGHIRTFGWLQQHVWGNDHLGGRSHVQSVVKRLRRKLRALGSPLHIDAVRGVGLRLVDTTAADQAETVEAGITAEAEPGAPGPG